jgi:hypothetical protein
LEAIVATVIKPPSPFDVTKYSVFLGGAIDQGKARPWQKEVAQALLDLDIIILDPRRDNWDESWEQCATCEPFRGQVLWEIAAQEQSDLNLYVFTAESKAPITFFELGAFGTGKEAMVCAEDGFYRQGNLDIYCEYYNIPIYHNFDEMIADLHMALEDKVNG